MRKFSIFNKRNIERNVIVRIDGIHSFFHRSLSSYLSKIVREFIYIKEKLKFYILGKVTIPQIEFILTTHCTLKCAKCAGYFSSLSDKEKSFLSFEDFKIQLDNLISNVDKVQNLILTGGEPLLSKNIVKICEYSLECKKVGKVWIFTNGTIDISDELFLILKKYHNKIYIRISNYSNNKDLRKYLKYKEILKKLEDAKCKYIFNEDKWLEVFNIKNYNRKKDENIKYFRKCLHYCLAVYKGILYVCPRGAILTLKENIKLEDTVLVDLNKKISKKDIVAFYNSDYFPYCNYCDFINERKQPLIEPAKQINYEAENEL